MTEIQQQQQQQQHFTTMTQQQGSRHFGGSGGTTTTTTTTASSTNNANDFGFSQIPGTPSFRNSSVNTVAIVPLLSTTTATTRTISGDGSSSSSSELNSNNTKSTTTSSTHSIKSFYELLNSLQKHNYCSSQKSSSSGIIEQSTTTTNDDSTNGLLLVIPNNTLTRPGDWRYNETPFSSFHWLHGCQRIEIIDGRPGSSRSAHDRLLNHNISRNWIDLYPSRRTAAVVGVLSLQDCTSITDFHKAEEELRNWCMQYSTPPYAVTLHGSNYQRDVPVVRMFVYDSFTEGSVDLSNSTYLGSNRIVAFPPSTGDSNLSTNIHLMNLHLNVVVNDLAVAIFRNLETKIKEYQDLVAAASVQTSANAAEAASKQSAARRTIQRFVSGATSGGSNNSNNNNNNNTSTHNRQIPIDDDDNNTVTSSTVATTVSSSSSQQPQQPAIGPKNLTIGNMAGLVNPESKLAKDSPTNASTASAGGFAGGDSGSGSNSTAAVSTVLSGKIPNLLTPLDDVSTSSEETGRSAISTTLSGDAIRKREIGRREKWCGDISLLAGSPLDAYEHYLKAAELLSTKIMGAGSAATNVPSSLDPLWHACALEGCAAAHIAMADCGGYNVDEYLENNFQLPEEVMVVLLSYQAAVAAAAAAASAAGDNNNNSDIPVPPKRVPTNKQTLPEVVFTLCEESLGILSRNQNLAHLYGELLLKLARYTADSAEGHLRCQWGNGPGCYTGTFTDDDGPTSHSGGGGDNVPRWMKTSTSKLLTLWDKGVRSQAASAPTGLNDMAMVNTLYRSKKVCELLHKAVAIGSLDPATRVDVAAQSTIICLNGLKPTNWRGLKVERMKLPRKAAFFSTVAAETFCLANNPNKARDLWLLSTQLYSRTPNPCDGYIGGSYGWASLRAYCLEALSMQGNSRISLEAGLELLSLLSELQPEKRRSNNDERLGSGTDHRLDTSKTPKTKNSRSDDLARYNDSLSSIKDENDSDRGISGGTSGGLRNDFGLSLDETEIREAVANAARNLRDNYRLTLANASALLSNQAKWTEGEPIPSVLVPFADLASLPTGLTTLKSVWPVTDYTTCVYAQKHCLDRIASLRRSLPTLSGFEAESYSIYGGTAEGQKLPLYVTSAMAIQADAALEMECVKKVTVPDKSKEGAMATFFNPYEAKKKDKTSTIRVAEEEERAMRITFGNRLSLPLEIRRSQLEFVNDTEGRVKAASLSFIIPARAKGFTVQFPFTILSRPTESGDGHDDNSTELEVKGLDLTCFGRSFFLPIQELSDTSIRTETGNLPESASIYPYRSTKKATVVDPDTKPRVETFPCQPRLHVLIAESGAPVDRFSIGLSDGEIYTLPKFRLENYMGPNARGKIERLQIYSANVPGTSEKKLYDSDADPVDDINEADFVKDLIWKENSPPLLLRVLVGSLKLSSINRAASTDTEEDTLTFQIAAAHNLGEKIPKGTTLHIRFRYRGLSSSSTEVWRKKEIVLQIRHAKGPRISSVAFRHDLSIESALGEMSLSRPASKPTKLVKKATTNEDDSRNNDEFAALRRVGLDNEIGICGDKSYFVLTVANETKSVLTLERVDGPVGGFERSPLLTITVRPGVSAKIPFVINRLPRIDADGKPVDIISELVARTSLIWKSHRGGESGPVKARGNIRIPPACLKDIISRHPSFVSHICQAPCSLDLFVGQPVASNSELRTTVGEPVTVTVNVDIESWVPQEAIDSCLLVVEFRCGRKRLHGTTNAATLTNSPSKEYCWSGKLRHAMPMNNPNKKHSAKIVFCVAGRYAVSACAKISQKGSASEEVWWAPIAQSVIVE